MKPARATPRYRRVLRADQWFGWQSRLHHEAAGARVHHADGAQCQQRHRLNGVAQFRRIVQMLGRQRSDEGFVQRAQQGGRGELGVLRGQMAGAHGGFDPTCDFA